MSTKPLHVTFLSGYIIASTIIGGLVGQETSNYLGYAAGCALLSILILLHVIASYAFCILAALKNIPRRLIVLKETEEP